MVDSGLILEGGGMRGLYTCGVLDYFLEKELEFVSIYGVSAGACHSCSFVSKQHGRAKRTGLDYLRDKRYASAYSFLKTGDFFGVKLSYDLVPNKLLPFDYDTFSGSKVKLYAVVTNCGTGEAEYMPVEDLRTDMDIIRASSSLPLLSRMVTLGREKYLDGGISDPIPIARSIADGNEKNVVILTRHRGYAKEPDSSLPLMRARYKKYPQLVEKIAQRHECYNRSLDLLERRRELGQAFIIQPTVPVEISRTEKDGKKLQALYEAGYRDAKEQFAALESFLGITGPLEQKNPGG